MNSPPLELIATAASGVEAVVKRELAALGYEARTVSPGRLMFAGDAAAICRANLWLRSSERVLVLVGTFPATDFGVLFEGTAALPWENWLPADAEFPVDGRSHNSQLSSVPACQRIVKRAIAKRLQEAHDVDHLPESGGALRHRDQPARRRGHVDARYHGGRAAQARLSSLGGRGATPRDAGCDHGAAQLLAGGARAGRSVLRHGHDPNRSGADRAATWRQVSAATFASEDWPTLDAQLWKTAREEARDLARPTVPERLLGYDVDVDVLEPRPLPRRTSGRGRRTSIGSSGRLPNCGPRPNTAV